MRKGFTLVELLVTIALLGIIGSIIIFNMTNMSNKSKEAEYEKYVASVKSAASIYATNNSETFNKLYVDKAFLYITISDLVSSGLVDEDLKNPYTEKNIDLDDKVKVLLDSVSGNMMFEYPIESVEQETFLVSVDDYIVWGEPYNCMQGAGSYQLSLSDEEGNLIILDDETIKKYNFTCSLPNSFVDYYTESDNIYLGKATKDAGNYEVTYNWVTENGVKKKATRNLRVLAKVKPSFMVKDSKGNKYNLSVSNWFTPEYDNNNNLINMLYYSPYIEGADKDSTTFKRYFESNLDNTKTYIDGSNKTEKEWLAWEGISEATAKENGNYSLAANTGDFTYYIYCTVFGHYQKEYYYNADSSVRIKVSLTVPSSFVTVQSTDWATTRTLIIGKGIYATQGITEYEYILSNETTPPEDTVSGTRFGKGTNPDLSKADTQNTYSIFTGRNTCPAEITQFKYIYFRAIEDKFVGGWSQPMNIYLTNQLDLLIEANSHGCADSTKCCLKENSDCYYSNKVKYISWGGKTFIVLERFNNGTILAAFDGVTENEITPTKIKNGKWEIETCDGTFSTRYKYSTLVLTNITDGYNDFLKLLPKTSPYEYTNTIKPHTWADKFTAYIGAPSKSMVEKYKDALSTPQDKPYWTTTSYKSGFKVKVSHGDSTTKYNSYYYAVSGNSVTEFYAGKSAYLKPLVMFKENIPIVSGDGSNSDPYAICPKI